ncbi:MAG: lysoplasmalogenase [Oscillospiraceae bacterium]|jgi:uncharacterized membrane protein YhhN
MTTWSGIAFLAFVILAVVNLIGLRSDDTKVNRRTKPLLMPLLALAYWLAMRGNESFALFLVIALLCGFLGDTFLLGTTQKLFTCGLLAFLAGHIFYILLFLDRTELSTLPLLGFILPLVVYVLLFWLVIKKLYPSLKKEDKPCVTVYMIAILLMNYAALQFGLAGNSYLPFVGSIFFVLSDTMLAFQHFKFRSTPFSRIAIMSTYLVAQMLITFGFVF